MRGKIKAELVFIPSPGRGHLLSMLKMANLLVDRSSQRLSITVLVIKPFNSDPSYSHLESNPRVRIIYLPWAEPLSLSTDSSVSFQTEYIDTHKDHVRNEVTMLVRDSDPTCNSRLAGFVVDMFCTNMIDVANEFDVATYVFFPSGASILGLMFHFQGLRDYQNQDLTVYEDNPTMLKIPSYENLVPPKLLPSVMFDRKNSTFLNHASRFRETKGILVNTFPGLESHALEYLSGGGQEIPFVYPIGPILDGGDDNHDDDGILKWLDEQPDSSVVFLCFGSRGCFGQNQVKEIATALERSGNQFLWSLRKPPVEKFGILGDYDSLEEVLPEGFLERTGRSGKVVGWAPQMAVLSHPAIRGFVSHCGWNSVLESLYCGVPVAVWPLFAEQQMNAFQVVEGLGVGVEVKMDYKIGSSSDRVLVKSEEIESGIRGVMGVEGGAAVRANVEDLKVKTRLALMENGSMFDFIGRFIDNVCVMVS